MSDTDGSKGDKFTMVYHTRAGTVNILKEHKDFASILEQFKLTPPNKQEEAVSKNHLNAIVVSDIVKKISETDQTTLTQLSTKDRL